MLRKILVVTRYMLFVKGIYIPTKYSVDCTLHLLLQFAFKTTTELSSYVNRH